MSLLLQITDGAAAVLLMTRQEALNRHLPILGIFRSFAAVGVDPAVMGIGPAVAIPAAVKMAGLTIDDIDLFELNEAFASQVGSYLLVRPHRCKDLPTFSNNVDGIDLVCCLLSSVDHAVFCWSCCLLLSMVWPLHLLLPCEVLPYRLPQRLTS